MIQNSKYFNSFQTALLLLPLIAIIGYITQIYSYDRWTEFFMAGFIIHGFLVISHPYRKYTAKTIGFSYLAGSVGSIVGYLNDSNSIVIALLATMATLHFTASSTDAFLEFEKLDEKEQKKISNRKWFISMLIGIVAFVGGAIFMAKVESTVNNDTIKTKYEESCTSSEFKKFKNHNAIAIAKCYDANNSLRVMAYYDKQGKRDDIYYYKDGKLDEIYDYYIANRVYYLKSHSIITSNKTRYNKPHLYRGIMLTYDYATRKPHSYKEMIINYIQDKETLYMEDGVEVFCDKDGKILEDVGSINKDDKILKTKQLDRKDIEIFKRLLK